MLDLRNYYRNENEKVRESYDSTLLRINEICDETADYQKLTEKREYYRFLNTTGNLILKLAELESNLCDEYFVTKFFEELYEENKALFSELLPANYVESYLNPTYCVKIFGDKYGQALSFIYVIYRQYINYAFFHKIFRMEETNRLFMNLFDVVKGEDFSYKALLEIINRNCKRDRTIEMTYDLKESFDKSFTYYNDIIEDSDINDLRYIFKYGRVITDYEIRTAKHLGNLPQDEINRLSTLTAKAYVDGFIRDEKDISIKSTVGVGFSIGQERIIRKLIENLKGYNLEAVVNSVSTTVVNKQYSYDHRFDTTMCLDEEFTSMMERCFGSAFEDCKEMASAFSGIIGFDKFGEPPFIPENKPECLKFTDEQQKIIQVFQNNMVMIQEKYMPRKEWSFTMIALPSPEIGDNYEQIFEDILRVNTLDAEKYELIQHVIISALDRADYVIVKGKGDNETDMKVKMQELKNPDAETNFLNCGADINIPVGEVFTSPRLTGTNGILHIGETYLGGLKYLNLRLTFKDGYIADYDCSNFNKEDDNKKYIEENLFFPHKTLPIGEFAIGTNTLAYMIAKKYDIINILPILIIEKMGPHFAIGDTCFSFEEDKPVFNKLDKKEITARDNEKTALRKTNVNEAYTYRHTDISIPYESIDFIAAVSKDGERIEIIRDGRFVLEGTEVLNEPFADM